MVETKCSRVRSYSVNLDPNLKNLDPSLQIRDLVLDLLAVNLDLDPVYPYWLSILAPCCSSLDPSYQWADRIDLFLDPVASLVRCLLVVKECFERRCRGRSDPVPVPEHPVVDPDRSSRAVVLTVP